MQAVAPLPAHSCCLPIFGLRNKVQCRNYNRLSLVSIPALRPSFSQRRCVLQRRAKEGGTHTREPTFMYERRRLSMGQLPPSPMSGRSLRRSGSCFAEAAPASLVTSGSGRSHVSSCRLTCHFTAVILQTRLLLWSRCSFWDCGWCSWPAGHPDGGDRSWTRVFKSRQRHIPYP
ncbi:hypothetical protein BGZ63DRAFT_239348 [Mariannaea sp. PMI_226]|nr:hypothetical protein BGZ63DRAFT_239348 [Mariannaea sp. PMI_226]